MKDTTVTALESAAESIVMAYGPNSQMVKASEELSELIQKLCKKFLGSPVRDSEVVDEIADVIIMAFQMRYVFGAHHVDEQIQYKLNKLMNGVRKPVPPPPPQKATCGLPCEHCV